MKKNLGDSEKVEASTDQTMNFIDNQLNIDNQNDLNKYDQSNSIYNRQVDGFDDPNINNVFFSIITKIGV